jgi:hypothetical protein
MYKYQAVFFKDGLQILRLVCGVSLVRNSQTKVVLFRGKESIIHDFHHFFPFLTFFYSAQFPVIFNKKEKSIIMSDL